jgi:sugar phosphate isomerase/epimerase
MASSHKETFLMPSDFSRRKFLAGMGATAAAAGAGSFVMARAADAPSIAQASLPIGFSTLGCPTWSWDKILDFAKQHAFTGVELRGLQGKMDLPACAEFSSGRIEQSKKEITAHGLHISCVDSSSSMHESDPQKNEAQLVDARRFIDLASDLGVPYIRVFGNLIEGPVDEAVARVAKSLRRLGDYSGPKNVTVLIESHGDFVHSTTLLEIFKQADSPHVALLWDANHTYVQGGEDPAFTVSQLGKYIRHTHLKDSTGKGDATHYVLTGRGEVPVKKQVQALVDIGYKGYFSYEWEKVWHPDLEEPEVAFPDYAEVMTGYLKDAYAHRSK